MFAEISNAANNLTKESAVKCISETEMCRKQMNKCELNQTLLSILI
jgi:hypothetical protein